MFQIDYQWIRSNMVSFFSKFVTPDQMTLLRVLLIPAIYVLILFDTKEHLIAAYLLFALACITDYWDGLLARHTGKTTDLGKLLDPIADKMLICSLLVLLIAFGRAPAFLTALIISREFAVSGLRSIAAVRGVVIPASPGGKIKTISQMFSVGFLILHHPTLWIPCHEVGIVLLYVATAITLWSGWKYFLSYYHIIKKEQPGSLK